MIGFVIWVVGLVLTIKAALEIWRIHAPAEKRVLFYYFDGKSRMPRWLGTEVEKY